MEGMRIDGDVNFVRAMRELERTVPGELDDALADEMQDILPDIQSATPVGTGRSGAPGRLRDATKVVATPRGRPAFVNRQPYAAVIHWGRKRRGVVKGTRFVTRTTEEHKDDIARGLGRRLTELMARALR